MEHQDWEQYIIHCNSDKKEKKEKKEKEKKPETNNFLKDIKLDKKIEEGDLKHQKINKELSKQKHKLVEYNEVIFHKPVSVVPIAVFGYRKIVKEVAKRYGLPYFVSAKKFYESLEIK